LIAQKWCVRPVPSARINTVNSEALVRSIGPKHWRRPGFPRMHPFRASGALRRRNVVEGVSLTR
jgi:hypothetical protein